jgi:hypothetical protein
MASPNPNLVKRVYENLMGTPEQNAKAAKEIAAYKAAKEKEKAKAEEEAAKKKTTNMAKGGAVKGFKACAGCPSPAKCKAAGKCMKAKTAKGGVPAKGKTVKSGSKAAKTGKTPLLAIMIGVPAKTKKAK